jgi:hypothetical protein
MKDKLEVQHSIIVNTIKFFPFGFHAPHQAKCASNALMHFPFHGRCSMHQIHEVFLRYLCWGRHVLEGMPCVLGLGTRATTIGAALTPRHALGYMLPLASCHEENSMR